MQLSHDVTEATKIVGKKEEATVDEMLKTIAMLRKLIHKSRTLVKEKDKKKDEYYQKAKEARMQHKDDQASQYLQQYMENKKQATQIRQRIDALTQNLHTINDAQITNEMMSTMKNVASCLDVISSQIDALKPEDLNDRFDDLDAYLKDIHAIDEDFVDEDEGAFDDYLNQLDADIAKEKVELPSVPADIPKTSVESKTKSGEQKQERRAVME
ncbi:hypothetical protein WA588_005952, partial [Blastocystis sp. NMH]